MVIGGFQKTSFIDYPGKVSSVIFTQGCNFRCGFCHNPELVDPRNHSEPLPVEEIFTLLRRRRKLLDGVVISGGEPLLQADICAFLLEIKKLGYPIKLDTNGSLPEKLQEIIDASCVDYIAMDIKAPLRRYKAATNVDIDEEWIKRSIEIIMGQGKEYEFRTTVVKSKLAKDDLLEIGELIKGAGLYVLQEFVPSDKMLREDFLKEETYSEEEFNYFKGLLEASLIGRCIIR